MKVRNSQDTPHLLHDGGIVEGSWIAGHELEVENPLLRLRPPVIRPHRNEHTAQRISNIRVEEPANQHLRVTYPLRKVGGEMNRYIGGQLLRPFHLDADLLAHHTPTITAEQIARSHGVLMAIRPVLNERCDTFTVLFQENETVIETDTSGSRGLGMGLEDWLQADLWQIRLAARAPFYPVGVS